MFINLLSGTQWKWFHIHNLLLGCFVRPLCLTTTEWECQVISLGCVVLGVCVCLSKCLCVHARIVLSVNQRLFLRIPWIDLRGLHPAPSFIEQEITGRSLLKVFPAARENIVIVIMPFFSFSLIGYNVANTQTRVGAIKARLREEKWSDRPFWKRRRIGQLYISLCWQVILKGRCIAFNGN